MAIQIVLGYPIQIHLLLLMRCKFRFRLFTDDWIMTGGKHWLFSFMKELSLFVESIKIPLTVTPYSNQGSANTSKDWGKT